MALGTTNSSCCRALCHWGLAFPARGVFLRTVVNLHGTRLVNSATHTWGSQRFATGDSSKVHDRDRKSTIAFLSSAPNQKISAGIGLAVNGSHSKRRAASTRRLTDYYPSGYQFLWIEPGRL
jgi:hypothetical protein